MSITSLTQASVDSLDSVNVFLAQIPKYICEILESLKKYQFFNEGTFSGCYGLRRALIIHMDEKFVDFDFEIYLAMIGGKSLVTDEDIIQFITACNKL